ncbi:MAG: type II toxin-antitoxin system RelE family toxin [Nitrospiria bacterium]
MFNIWFSAEVEADIKKISLFYRNRIMDEIEVQLTNDPTAITKNKKILINLSPPWTGLSIVRELRVGEFRIFYDVDEPKKEVFIRAVRKKPPGKTTEEIL